MSQSNPYADMSLEQLFSALNDKKCDTQTRTLSIARRLLAVADRSEAVKLTEEEKKNLTEEVEHWKSEKRVSNWYENLALANGSFQRAAMRSALDGSDMSAPTKALKDVMDEARCTREIHDICKTINDCTARSEETRNALEQFVAKYSQTENTASTSTDAALTE